MNNENEGFSCRLCGASEDLENFEVAGETIQLCPDCRDEHLKQCSQCNKYFLDNETDYAVDREGDIYCESCRDEFLSYCEHCDEYSNSEDFVHLDDTDEWWCRSCAGRDAYQCMDCSDWISENHGDSNHILCSGCFEAHYTCCSDCGDLVHSTIVFPLTTAFIANPATTKTIRAMYTITVLNHL